MCFAQGHNAVTLVRLEPGPLRLESSILPLSHCAPTSEACTYDLLSSSQAFYHYAIAPSPPTSEACTYDLLSSSQAFHHCASELLNEVQLKLGQNGKGMSRILLWVKVQNFKNLNLGNLKLKSFIMRIK